jgi:hypothetical protein
MSRSASEPDSASKNLDESGQSSQGAEASIRREEMIKRSGGTLRGVRGRRVSKGNRQEPGRPGRTADGNKTIGEVERESITAKAVLSGSRRRP